MKWISVEDRMPDDESGYKVLVFANDIISSWVELINYNGEHWVHNGGKIYPPIVTHWQPIPKPPSNP